MGRPPLVSALDLLRPAARSTVQADKGLTALFARVDRRPEAAPKEVAAAAIADRTLWQFRGAMNRLVGCSWHDFLRILHLREKRAQGPNLLKKAKAVARDAGFQSLKCMRAAETWALKKRINLDAPLAETATDTSARTGTVLQFSSPESNRRIR